MFSSLENKEVDILIAAFEVFSQSKTTRSFTIGAAKISISDNVVFVEPVLCGGAPLGEKYGDMKNLRFHDTLQDDNGQANVKGIYERLRI